MLPINDIERLWRKHCHAIGPIALQDLAFAQAVIAELIDKLTAGVELPMPAYIWHDNPYDDDDNEMFEVARTGLVDEGDLYPDEKCKHCTRLFTLDQLLAYGASQRLAGREQVLNEASALNWVEIMREGGLVTWGDAGTLGYRVVEHLRALAASPQEQQP